MVIGKTAFSVSMFIGNLKENEQRMIDPAKQFLTESRREFRMVKGWTVKLSNSAHSQRHQGGSENRDSRNPEKCSYL